MRGKRRNFASRFATHSLGPRQKHCFPHGCLLVLGTLEETVAAQHNKGALVVTTSTSDMGHFPDDLTDQVARDGHDPVASGGFADIYRGMLQDNGQFFKVAIKAIKTYSGEDGNFAKKHKRLRREIKVWLNLRHDNVLLLLGTAMGFGRFPAMVCPWVENGTLSSYLDDRYDSLSVIEILDLLNDVASGLHYLHSHSVVHGDLSGSNVLVHGNGRACIADFGLSMLLTEIGASTFATSFHARGTLRWTAPELLDLDVNMDEDSPRVAATTQSDVYSFGSITLQILSGKVPYHYYKREVQVLHAISKRNMPRRPISTLITERRWMFIQRCWSAVGARRPLSEKIVEFIKGELAEHRPGSIMTAMLVEDVDPHPCVHGPPVESTATHLHPPPDEAPPPASHTVFPPHFIHQPQQLIGTPGNIIDLRHQDLHPFLRYSESCPLTLYDLRREPWTLRFREMGYPDIMDHSVMCPPIEYMRIHHPRLSWDIEIRSNGRPYISLADFFQQLFAALNKPIVSSDFYTDELSDKDRHALTRAYFDRCRTEEEKMEGVKRVDFLRRKTEWQGLSPDQTNVWLWRLETTRRALV